MIGEQKCRELNLEWLSRDPLENAELLQGPNLYTYVWNSPTNYNDPDGCIVNFAIGAVIGLGVEAISQTISGDFNIRRLTTSTLVGSLTGGVGGSIAKKELKTGQATHSNIFSHFSDQRRKGQRASTNPT